MADNDGTTISAYEFFKSFPNEASAIEYIEGLRWADGIICPHCDSQRTGRMKDTQYHQCKDCRQKFTVRTGTVFERRTFPWINGFMPCTFLKPHGKALAASNYPRS